METYGKDHDALQARLQIELQENEVAKSWLEFLRRHSELQYGGFANKNIFISYFGTGYPAQFTVAALEESYLNPELRKQLAIDDSDNSGERQKLLVELREVFHGPPDNWQNELAGARYLTNTQLREKIELLRSKHEMQKLDIPALQEVIRSGTPTPVRPELPASYTRKVIMNLSGRDLKSLMEKYGDQVTYRINGMLWRPGFGQ